MMKKGIVILLAIAIIFAISFEASAATPYQNYLYTADGEESVVDTQAYLPGGIISGEMLGVGTFSAPEDIFIAQNRLIYLADTGNNRILVFDENARLNRVISTFRNGAEADSFAEPAGVFMDTDNRLYIADSQNDRIVVLDEDDQLCRIITLPETPLLDGIRFEPERVVVDHSGRVFAISPNTNKGIIGIDRQGNFTGFYGALKTKSTLDIFKRLATEKQRETMEQSVPVAYSNMAVDAEGFVFTTVALTDISGGYNPDIFIRKLNPSGNDVLTRKGKHDIIGDVVFEITPDEQKNSTFCDIAVLGNSFYAALDQRYGRVFTYDKDGNLLFVFGAKGDSFGQFSAPVSLAVLDHTFFAVDRNLNQIVTFSPTRYGELLIRATDLYADRDYDAAEECYDELLGMSVLSDVIYQGKANCLYHREEYVEAMKYFKYCANKPMYIEAFKYARNEWIDRAFPYIMSGGIGVLLILIVISVLKKRKNGRENR